LRRAIYPGSFDPVTNGHLDIITRAAAVFDELIVALATNMEKRPMFTVEERVEMLRAVTEPIPKVTVDVFPGLLAEYARAKGAHVIVKGLRAVTDFEFEFQMALMNRQLDPEIETLFMMTAAEHSYLSSSIVKEIASLGGSVSGLVPEAVAKRIADKLARR
jgi:pantetheine-phosphate adenylyltransferase